MENDELTRRDFVSMTVAAGLAAAQALICPRSR